MGVFGTITAICPECGENIEFQTKETMQHLDADDAFYFWSGNLPDGLLGTESTCPNCGYSAKLTLVNEPTVKAV